MRTLPPPSGLAAIAAILVGAVAVPLLTGWTTTARAIELSAFVLAAMLASLLRMQALTVTDRAIMAPSFVLVFATMLLFGPHVAALAAVAVALTPFFTSPRPGTLVSLLGEVAIAAGATAAAGFGYQFLRAALGDLGWPWQAGPIVAAVLVYHVLQGGLAEIVIPFASRKPINRAWPKNALRGCPVYRSVPASPSVWCS